VGFVVVKPGLLSTIQDMGRSGYMGSGFAPNGVMDKRAAAIANILVDNNVDDCVLEFALTGPVLRFTTPTFIALTGVHCNATLDGKPVGNYTAVQVQQGQVLDLSSTKNGIYGYLAVTGGSVRVPEVMGSRSTNLKAGIGGFCGRALQSGDYLPFCTKISEYLPNQGSHSIVPDAHCSPGDEEVVLRVVPGPQEELFSPAGIETFYSESYTTSQKCDRMGYRLEGPAIETLHGSDIISDGIAYGAVQVPTHGRPIILLSDRQTTGGYAKIGTVASVDIPKLVQCMPGRRVRFERIDVHDAQRLYREQHHWFENLRRLVHRPCLGGISPRRTSRRLAPILERQAELSVGETLWIDR
jgi:biotin-dependent carboxylase-like uncharacterized protein